MPEASTDEKEQHRVGTSNRWEAPDGDWAAEHDWTRYRGPDPWPVPGGWAFKDPEGGGWWQYFGEAGVGHHDHNSIFDELEADPSVDDPYDALDEARAEYAYLTAETANPDEVSVRNPEDEELEWTLEIDDAEIFRCVAPDRSDLMAAVADALAAHHAGDLNDKADDIAPTSGQTPTAASDHDQEQDAVEQRQKNNRSLGDFSATSQETDRDA